MEKQKNNYLVKYCLLPIKEEKHGKIGNEFQTTVCYIVSKAFIVEEYKVNFQSGTSKTTYKACFPYIVNNNRINHLRKLPDDDLARNNEAVVSKLFDTYEDSTRALTIRNRKVKGFISIVVMVLIILFTMLISCRFKYGLIVVGSNSMMGALEKGDALLFDSKDNNIMEGQVILYKKEDLTIIHRVVRIEEVNGVKQIYTKGDNNAQEDIGFITYENLQGIAKFKIKKLGLPTIWVNELFK